MFQKYHFFILFIVLAAFTTLAQDTIQWSETFQFPRGTLLDKTVTVGNNHYLVRRSTRYVYLEVYSNDMQFINARKFDLKYDDRSRDFEGIYFLGDKKLLLTSYHNKAKQRHYLFYQEIDPELKIGEINLLADMEAKKLATTGSFSVSLSDNRQRLMIVNEVGIRKRDRKTLTISVFDDSLEKLLRKNVTLRYENGKYEIQKLAIGNNGNIFVLGKADVDNRNSNTYSLLTYTNLGDEKKEFKFNLRDKYLHNVSFKLNKKDSTLLVAGFYSNKNTSSKRGIFLSQISLLDQEILSKTTKEFDFETRVSDLSERKREKAERKNSDVELKNYYLKDIVLREDGGAILFSEQINVSSVSQAQLDPFFYNRFGGFNNFGMFDPFGRNMFNDNNLRYDYNNILVTNVNPDGTIAWNLNVPKFQTSLNDGGAFSSFFNAVTPDRIYLFFSDRLENLENVNSPNFWTRRDIAMQSSEGYFVVTEITPDGTFEIYPLMHEGINRFVKPIPSLSEQTGRYEITFIGSSADRFQWGKLRIPRKK